MLRRLLLLLAVILALPLTLSVRPLWKLLWHYPVYSMGNCRAMTGSDGITHDRWRWAEDGLIRVYWVDARDERNAQRAAALHSFWRAMEERLGRQFLRDSAAASK